MAIDEVVEELFGTETRRGLLSVTDFRVDSGKRETRTYAAIDHLTGGAKEPAIYHRDVMTGAVLSGLISLGHGGLHTSITLHTLLKRSLSQITLGARQSLGLGRIDSCRMSRNPDAEEWGLSHVERARRRLVHSLIIGLQRAPETINEIESREFERVIAQIFQELGFRVRLTPTSKDGGKDLVLFFLSKHSDRTLESQTYYVELKHWRPSGQHVGAGPIRKLLDVAVHDATGAILLSTSGFAATLTQDAALLARVSLGDLSTINTLVNLYARSRIGAPVRPSTLQEIADLEFEAIPIMHNA
jgi:hypothetical protein